MTKPILEFWFEFASTYSHIAAQRIEATAKSRGVDVAWKPFLLGPLFVRQGWNDSPFNIYPAKGAYMWKDLERECAKHEVPFRKPSQFPRQTLLPARVALALESTPQLADFARRVFVANFVADADIANREVIHALLEGI